MNILLSIMNVGLQPENQLFDLIADVVKALQAGDVNEDKDCTRQRHDPPEPHVCVSFYERHSMLDQISLGCKWQWDKGQQAGSLINVFVDHCVSNQLIGFVVIKIIKWNLEVSSACVGEPMHDSQITVIKIVISGMVK